jgi:hypothetical protein
VRVHAGGELLPHALADDALGTAHQGRQRHRVQRRLPRQHVLERPAALLALDTPDDFPPRHDVSEVQVDHCEEIGSRHLSLNAGSIGRLRAVRAPAFASTSR